MKLFVHATLLTILPILAQAAAEPAFKDHFNVEKSDFASSGRSDYFILEPGYVAAYEGKEEGEATVLTITVTKATKMVDGVETRVVEEKEIANGKIKEISRNYFAISKSTGDVYYFGEDSDSYKDGKVADHNGSWLAGVSGARFGLAMPGKPKVGGAYYQELAPKVAMDRVEVVSVSDAVTTPAGAFKDCVKTKETSKVEKGSEYKWYAKGVGMVIDGKLKLVKYSFIAR